MFGLVWLSLVVVMLGTTFDDTTWFDALESRDASLPVTTAGSDPLCYYFKANHVCSATAVKDLLQLGADPDLTTFTPDANQCKTLQTGLRMLAEHVASDVFGTAITSATAAGVTNFELLTQIWALQVGYLQLKTDTTYPTFVTALNSVSDWTTVHCVGSDLSYDGNTIALPDFVVTAHDCPILGALYVSSPDCSADCASSPVSDAEYCCNQDVNSNCCNTFGATYCGDHTCDISFMETCCVFDNGGPCCMGP